MKNVLEFRLLQANEIQVRAGQKTKTGKIALLLYKDARADMARLDEQFGSYGWQREHKDVHGVSYCGVSLWDDEKHCWVTKWDAGEPSNTSPQKGEASDSFKRACVNWGIGRELYTAPRVYIPIAQYESVYGLRVSAIGYDESRKINALTIVDDKGNIIYQYGQKNAAERKQTAQAAAVPVAPQEQKPQAKSESELDELFQSLTEREITEYNDACKQMKNAADRPQVVTIYNRYVSSNFAPLLLAYGNKILKEKGI